MTPEEAKAICRENCWGWIYHPAGMWVVGPQTADGDIEGWGAGRELEEAVAQAKAIC